MNDELRIREDWVECTLNELVSKLGDGLHGTPKYSENGEYFFINGNNLSNGKILIKENTKKVSRTEFEKYKKILNDRTILVSINGTIGNLAFYDNEKVVLGKSACYFNLLDGINKKYIRFLLASQIFMNYALKIATGSTIKNVPLRGMRAFKIPLPPIPIQKAIVKKLETLFSSLDSGIADLKKAQAQLKVYRQAVLKKAFEGELTKEWREQQTDLPSADELLEQIKEERNSYIEKELTDWKNEVKLWKKNGSNTKRPNKPKFVKELEDLSEEELKKIPSLNRLWRWIKVDKIANHDGSSLKAGPFGSSLKKEFYTESGYKIYGQEQVIANNHKIGDYYVNQEKYDSLINCAVKPYDILISLVGTVGKVLVLPKNCEDGIINPRLVKISLNKFYNSIFFKYYFESAFLKSLYSLKAHGATMDILNLGIIKELPYPLCSIKEQHQIVKEIETRLSVCEQVEKDIADSLEKANALRQSILKKAFEGKLLSEAELAQCKADADYEPASVLLEKIKAEKKK